jgi:hypothetical protein
LETGKETSAPNNPGSSKEAINRAKYESYKQDLNEWFSLLGKDTRNLNIETLEEMSKSMDAMDTGFFDLVDNEFEFIDLTKDWWGTFSDAKADLNAALSVYDKNKKSQPQAFFRHLSDCRKHIFIFIRQLAAEEAFSASEELEPLSETQGGSTNDRVLRTQKGAG